MKVYVVLFKLNARLVACEVAAENEAEAIRIVKNDQYSRNAVDIKVMGELNKPTVLRWLPYIPSKSRVKKRDDPDEERSKIYVFDGDDTLWYVEWKYSQAVADFFSYLYKILREHMPNFHFLQQIFFALDEKNSKSWGIKRGRVAESMLETYRMICQMVKKQTGQDIQSPEHEARIRFIGDQPFDVQEHHWIPGAEEMLEELLKKGHTPCLLTKYDRGTWPEKATQLRLSRFIPDEHILVVEGRKRVEDFWRVAEAAGADDSCPLYTVGNSEGDMIPVEAHERWNGFYIPLPSTVPLERDTRPTGEDFTPAPYNHPRVKTLKSIRELVDYL